MNITVSFASCYSVHTKNLKDALKPLLIITFTTQRCVKIDATYNHIYFIKIQWREILVEVLSMQWPFASSRSRAP